MKIKGYVSSVRVSKILRDNYITIVYRDAAGKMVETSTHLHPRRINDTTLDIISSKVWDAADSGIVTMRPALIGVGWNAYVLENHP